MFKINAVSYSKECVLCSKIRMRSMVTVRKNLGILQKNRII